MRIFEIKNDYDALLAQAIDIETGEIKDELALEAFEKLEFDLAQKAIAYACVIKTLEAQAEALKLVAGPIIDRADVLANRADALREALRQCLPIGYKAEESRARVSVREGNWKTEIADEAKVPRAYREARWFTLRSKILEDLKAGLKIRGAKLKRGDAIVSIK